MTEFNDYLRFLMFQNYINLCLQIQAQYRANLGIEEDDSGDIEMPDFYEDDTGFWITDESQIEDAPWLIVEETDDGKPGIPFRFILRVNRLIDAPTSELHF